MPKGKSPISFKEGGRPDPDAQYTATLGFLFSLPPLLFFVGLVLGLFTKDVFCLTKY